MAVWGLLEELVVEQNSASFGGGLYLNFSSPTLRGMRVSGNRADASGGGLYLWYSSSLVTQGVIDGNEAHSEGGGLYIVGWAPTLSDMTVSGNHACNGGGLYLYGSHASLSQVVVSNNSAEKDGGGIEVLESDPTLTQVTVVGNYVELEGAGVHVTGTSVVPTIRNSVLAYNFPYNLYATSGNPKVFYSDLYNNATNHNLSSLDSSNLTLEPQFVLYSPNRKSDDDLLYLQPDSPLRDMGDPSLTDDDGSRSDMGCYGGPDGDPEGFLEDTDGDGLYDGWELSFFGSLTVQAGASDEDGDLLSNRDELTSGSDPSRLDTDGDGYSDFDEVMASRSPVDAGSQPGVSAQATLYVPEEFETIQEAVDAILVKGVVEVAAGWYEESLEVIGKRIWLWGEGSGRTILAPPAGRALTIIGKDVEVVGFTLSGGSANYGGNALINSSSGALCDLTLENGKASYGGGLYLKKCYSTMSHVAIMGASATQDGGGLYLSYAGPVATQLEVRDCSAVNGGGLYLDHGSPVFVQLGIVGNRASAKGGGVNSYYGWPTFKNALVAYNTGTYNFYSDPVGSAPTVLYSAIYDPQADNVSGFTLGSTCLSSVPQLLTAPVLNASSGKWEVPDLHLSLTSPLVNVGEPSLTDADGSRSDMGIYGGAGGDDWNRDGDPYPDYYWPGELEDAPSGVDPDTFDSDDQDGTGW